MTVTEMAKRMNVSTMTVYRRLKRASVNIEELRDADSGELTAAGVAAIASLFDATGPQQDVTDDATQAQQGGEGVTTGAKAATDAVEIARLTATVDGLRALVAQLEGERDELRRQLDAVTAALHAEQADRSNERRLLTAGSTSTAADAGQQRRGLFDFFRRNRGQ